MEVCWRRGGGGRDEKIALIQLIRLVGLLSGARRLHRRIYR